MKAIESHEGQPQRPEGSRDMRERGQALILVIFAIFGLLVLVGLAVDLGLYYIERVRIVRAVDSATLAAAYELPLEAASRVQAIDYLQQNGYDVLDPDTALVVDGVTVSASTSGLTKTVIYLDTAQFQDPPGTTDTAYRIEIKVRRKVPVVFMQFAGFGNVFTEASAVAENINNLDVAIVFDTSGSMEFDTLCYGCWEPDADEYPSGDLYPLRWDGAANGTPQRCSAAQRYTSGGYDYYFVEAEEYSYTNNTYNRDLYSVGYTYWVLQRTTRDGSASSSSRDGRAAYIMHMPFPDMEYGWGAGVACRYGEVAADVDPADGQADGKCWSGAPGGPYGAPRVDYNFTPLENRPGGYYIWVRGQSRNAWNMGAQDTRIFWGMDGVLGGAQHRSGNCGVGCEPDFPRGIYYDGANSNWGWRRLNDDGPLYLTQGANYTLNIWAGGAGIALDRIVITSSPNSGLGPLEENGGKGRAVWANGRGGWVCNPCDARFGGYPSDHADRPGGFNPTDWVSYYPACDIGPAESRDRREDYIYDDEQPMRASVEAAKAFVRELLDPSVDQVGYVDYDDDSQIISELQCVRRLGRENCTEDVIEVTVIDGLDGSQADGGTSIGGGMEDGLDVLSTRTGHYGRPGATHVMILMTDGVPTALPNSACYSDPDRQWLDGAGSNEQDCVIYYAHEARNSNVIVYTITLGVSADFELMQAVADLTGGVHRNADRPEKLPEIFEELYELMYLRLIK